ncbi:unnamed protein product [Zymoseptoria tritici ST99CH_1E4]|uniref:Partial AB-hydrolase lipase domain-containing protein n=1 Tax=Zymoseptoria tritici ST99CH_1E4 TaxID=1276532 RepID=A0A2H1FLX2_ZYMTR|nr:unnamed protein product [Zymoseptoria tritici ST99CH_1E4]
MAETENLETSPDAQDDANKEKASEFIRQAQHLAQFHPSQETPLTGSTQAAKAIFITPLDPVIETVSGKRLPTIPVDEALKLNRLKDEWDGGEAQTLSEPNSSREKVELDDCNVEQSEGPGVPLGDALPPSRTHPLFPPLPLYGPPTRMRELQCLIFRATSSVLSLLFLLGIVLGAIVTGIRSVVRSKGVAKHRPFLAEERKRRAERKAAEREWSRRKHARGSETPSGEKGMPRDGEFVPTEGGPDPLCTSIAYYARRVGLDAEVFNVQTEDGFIIELWHVYHPRDGNTKPKYPVLLMHGLLQSALAFCSNSDDSLAFYLCKSGFDVWLGNNRCGFNPRHASLSPTDPRMWAWNIRQMGVMDLSALIERVLSETGFPKLALVAHSQGTTQTFVALAKEQCPDLGRKISVFCALAPAAYSGPLIRKAYFQFMQILTPAMFRMVFGIHSFIPIMMFAHRVLPAAPFAWMGYHVYSFLFGWSDSRWERDLRNRMFQSAPVYVSAESMRWWLGREGFAKQKCILSTREEGQMEDAEDEEDEEVVKKHYAEHRTDTAASGRRKLQRNLASFHCPQPGHRHHDKVRAKFAWYDERFPPLALWVCGEDDLVDGRRLLRRFDRGREPHVRVVHQKVIEGYEHLDVIWAMDSIQKVGIEVREVIWRTADEKSRERCRVPIGCEGRESDQKQEEEGIVDVPMVNSSGRARMASIREGVCEVGTGKLQIDRSRAVKEG